MSMNCVKTGCVIYLPEYHEIVRCDHFTVADIDIFRTTAGSREQFNTANGDPDLVVHRIHHWFEDRPYGTLIAFNSEVSPFK